VNLEAGMLSYFVTSRVQNGITTGVELKGELNLQNAKVFKGCGKEKQFIRRNTDKQLYVVAGTDELNLFLEASTPSEAVAWISALEEHARFATQHPSMVPQLGHLSNSTSSAVDTHIDQTERISHDQQGETSADDCRFNNSVLKCMVTPTMYGILLKTRDESSCTAIFISIVSHPLCHDSPATHYSHRPSVSTSDNHTVQPQPLTLVNPRCWYFKQTAKENRHTATKLGFREYCEPSLVIDGEPYVVLQVLVSVEVMHDLLQELRDEQASAMTDPRTIPMTSKAAAFPALVKAYTAISSALIESHQIASHQEFSVVVFKEQEHLPFFVSPMEIVLGRDDQTKNIQFITTMENIQRHTELITPIAGVRLKVQGQGVIPPNTVRSDVNIVVNLNSHTICDIIRNSQHSSTAVKSSSISSTQLNEHSQRDLRHSLEECAKAVYLLGEGVHHTDKDGTKFYSYDVTTNTTIIRLFKLEQIERQRQQKKQKTTVEARETAHNGDDSEGTGSRSFRISASPSVVDIVTMYVLQSLNRYFGVKMSGYSSSLNDLDEQSPISSSVGAAEGLKSIKIIKFSALTHLACPMLTKKESNLSNDYDSFLDPIDGDGNGDQNFLSVTNVYSHDSFSISPNDIIYTETEFFSCKLKELNTKGANILDELEDELADMNSIQLDVVATEEVTSHQCVRHIVSSDVPVYVLDFPLLPRRAKAVAAAGGLTASAPSITAKIWKGDKVNVFCVKDFPSDTRWLLLDAGWIPAEACEVDNNVFAALPSRVELQQPENKSSDEHFSVLVKCIFTATRCKGKSGPFRRQLKNCAAENNPFTYDKSTDSYDSVPFYCVLRERALIDDILEKAPAIELHTKGCSPSSNFLQHVQDHFNMLLKRDSLENEVQDCLREFFTPTETDRVLSENALLESTL